MSAAIAAGDLQVAAAEAELEQMLREGTAEKSATEISDVGVETHNDPHTNGHLRRDLE